jgi:hypothetical protein
MWEGFGAYARSGPAPATPSPALRRLASRYESNRTYVVSINRTSAFALDSPNTLVERQRVRSIPRDSFKAEKTLINETWH